MALTITISGMTCENCVRHVTRALRSVPGVDSAEVDLQSGSARLETHREVARHELASALEEAGYSLT